MAETIKGISVLIEGDTTGLSKALADVNKSSRDVQSELKQVDKLLKLDPTNTELLAQKQTLLTNAIANTKEKLDALKAAQEQVNAQFAAGTINEGQYRAFQREIAATENQLRSFETQLNNTNESSSTLANTLEQSGEKIGKVGEKIKGAGEKMSIGITAPVVAAGGLILKGAVDAENAQGKLQASLGITADEASKLGAVAKEVWKDDFGDSIESVDEAIVTIKKNMSGLADSDLKAVTEGAMTIADVFGAEVADSSKAAGTMMKNFGISGQDALDLITVGFQKGGDYSGELLDTLNEYSPQFVSMGLTADQAMGILIAGAQAGSFSLDKVGDAMKEFNIRAQDGSKTTAGGFEAIGLDAEKMSAAMASGGEDAQKAFTATITALSAMKDPIQQNAAGTALFGTQWEDVRAKVIIAMADGVKGIGDFKGATDSAAKAMYDNNPGAALSSAMRGVQAAIGPALLPLADIIKNTIVPAIKSLTDWFTNLSPAGQKTVLAIVAIAAAIGPMLTILGPIITAIGSLVAGVGAISAAMAGGATGIAILTTAFPALGTAIAVITGPIGIVIAVIAGLAAIALLIYKNWEPIKLFFTQMWEGIKAVFSGFWVWLKGFFSKWGSEILAVLVPFIGLPLLIIKHWDDIKAALSAVWEWIKSIIAEAWTAISSVTKSAMGTISGVVQTGFDSIKSGVSTIWEGIKNYFTGIWAAIKNIFLGAMLLILDLVTGDFTKLKADAEAIWNNLKVAFKQIWTGIQQVFQGSLDAIKDVLKLAWDTISGALKTVWDGIKTYFSTLWGDIKTSASNAWEEFKKTITATTTNIINSVKLTWNSLLTWFTELPAKLKQYAVDMFTSMKDGVTTTVSQVKDAIVSGIQSALDWITGLPAKMLEYGKNIIQGLIDGIQSMIANVGRIVSNLVEGIKTKIRDALGISSPSKVMMEIGQYTGLGFAQGMANTVGEVSRQAGALAGAAISKGASIGNGSSASASKGTSQSSINHTGTIRVEGINSKGQLQEVIDILIDKLQMEARMA